MNRIDRESIFPYYIQLAKMIEMDIERGVYKPLSLIPSERELSRTHNLSRSTVRCAIQILKEKKIIEKIKGKGTMVTADQRMECSIVGYDSFQIHLNRNEKEESLSLIDWNIRGGIKGISSILNLDDISLIIEAVRLRFLNHKVKMIEKIFMPRHLFPSLQQKDFEPSNIFLKMIRMEYGVEIKNTNIEIEPIILNSYESDLLGVNENFSSGLLVGFVTFSKENVPVCLLQNIIHKDQCKSVFCINRL